jgi:mannose-6-phosphate isomerase
MAPVFRIEPAVQRYAWGDPRQIPELLGFAADGGPYAEAWWGAHPAAPALAHGEGLDAVIARDPIAMLGETVAERWGELPFLLKVLAISAPLSIQVHPTIEQAQEIRAAYATGEAPLPDDGHKPEMIVALTPMRLLVGVRPVADLAADLRELATPHALFLADVVAAGDVASYLEAVLADDEARTLLEPLAAAAREGRGSRVLAAAADALGFHPGDTGALVALALNAVELQPGEACFTGSGVLHSYQSGLGLEIMPNSDNVLRAGLTPKALHVPLVLDVALTEPCEPTIPAQTGDDAVRHYLAPVSEYSLAVVSEGEVTSHGGPRVVVAIDGDVTVTVEGETVELRAGQAVFIPDADGPAVIAAEGLAAVASVPVT